MPRIRNVGELDWQMDESALQFSANAQNRNGFPLVGDLTPDDVRLWRNALLFRLDLDETPPSEPIARGIFYLSGEMKTFRAYLLRSRLFDQVIEVGHSEVANVAPLVIKVADVLAKECKALLVIRPDCEKGSYLFQMATDATRGDFQIRYPTRYICALANKINRALR
jgi:hypothetical protein